MHKKLSCTLPGNKRLTFEARCIYFITVTPQIFGRRHDQTAPMNSIVKNPPSWISFSVSLIYFILTEDNCMAGYKPLSLWWKKKRFMETQSRDTFFIRSFDTLKQPSWLNYVWTRHWDQAPVPPLCVIDSLAVSSLAGETLCGDTRISQLNYDQESLFLFL